NPGYYEDFGSIGTTGYFNFQLLARNGNTVVYASPPMNISPAQMGGDVSFNFPLLPVRTGEILVAPSIQKNPNARGLVYVIHGWTPPWASSAYDYDAIIPNLANSIINRFARDGIMGQWDVQVLDWSDHSIYNQQTGLSSGGLYPQLGVANSFVLGPKIGAQIIAQGYSQVHLIGHSAGAWLANSIAQYLNLNGIPATTTLLDAFVPSKCSPLLQPPGFPQSNYTPDLLGQSIPMPEQYYYYKSLPGAGEFLPNCANYDVSLVQNLAYDTGDSHGWPVRWYTLTVNMADYGFAYGYGYSDFFSPQGYRGSLTILPPGAIPLVPHDSPLPPPSSTITFAYLNQFSQNGDGNVSVNGSGVQLATSSYLSESWAINSTNDFNFGVIAYAFSNACNAVLGLWVDGSPITMIQCAPQNALNSSEIFPIPCAINSGSHILSVSLESLDSLPIAVTLQGLALDYIVSPPQILPYAITNGILSFAWNADAGLKYQSQINTNLSATNWFNFGPVLTSPTNTVFTASDAVGTNKQKFYRVVVVP
ncbi:MAG: hypothetical protein P4N59_08425, partial [Negativicutes bacterium]|nr:hypothetical protein [Negativicutes bacterium]